MRPRGHCDRAGRVYPQPVHAAEEGQLPDPDAWLEEFLDEHERPAEVLLELLEADEELRS